MAILRQHYQRLSESEKLIMLWLADRPGLQLTRKPTEFTFSESVFFRRSCLYRDVV